jgi:acyl-CoA synthetase (AMP-forming)/AMP-acid ligase II
MNLADALGHHARSRPDHPALVEGVRTILYRDLDPLVRRTAGHMAALGLERGEIVGVALGDTADHLVALYGLARLGAVNLPMDVRWTVEEKTRLARFFGAHRVLVEEGAEPLPGLASLTVGPEWHAAVARAADLDRAAPGGDAPLLLSLSSGTTGIPKGPMLTHHQFLRRFWTHWINLGLNSHDRYVSATPLYFGGGRTFAMSQLFTGGTVIMFPPPYAPEELVAEIARRRATSVFLVPTLLRRLLELPTDVLAPMRALRQVLSSGSALHPEERRAIRSRLCPGFFEYYASTEGGGVSLLTPEDQEVYEDSVGRPVFAVDVEIVDEAHRPVPAGTVGRLRYRGPGVATGFHGNPEETARAFHDGWFYPGDLAAVDERGYVFLKGRFKDMIIRAGVNIYPTEIEAILLGHAAVTEAAVVGWPSREFGEEVAAFVTVSGPVSERDLAGLCRRELAPYKVPRRIFVVDELPKNSLGKILKAALSESLPSL